MRNFWGMSRGEFVGTAALLTIILAVMLFNLFYHRAPEQYDLSSYAARIESFEQRQAAYADSVAAAHSQQDSAYAARRQTSQRGRLYHKHQVYSRESFYCQEDTSKLKPLQKRQNYFVEKVELNTCDTDDIVRIPQFGSKRAMQIVEYRDRLGGFHSLEQLHEIYILRNVNLEYCEKYFTVNPSFVKKIKVNSMTYNELKSHPYFDAYLAKTVVSYRKKNGKINNLAEFQKITHAYQELMDKLAPYLSFE